MSAGSPSPAWGGLWSRKCESGGQTGPPHLPPRLTARFGGPLGLPRSKASPSGAKGSRSAGRGGGGGGGGGEGPGQARWAQGRGRLGCREGQEKGKAEGWRCVRGLGCVFEERSAVPFPRSPPSRRGGSWISREAVSGPSGARRGSRGVSGGTCAGAHPEARPAACPACGRRGRDARGGNGPHCILSGCSCGGWYCTNVAPAGAAAERAWGTAAG